MDLSNKINKEKIKNWLNEPVNLLVLGLIIFTVVVKFYYFFMVAEQPVWWDEGDYLAIAKVWANGMDTPEWWSHFTGMRPLLLPLIWALMFKFGFGEMTLRVFTLLIPSIGTIIVTYLLGRDLYNKYVGIIAGFMMSCYWVWGFYSYRLLTDIPAVFFGTLGLYLFWKYYKRNNIMHLYSSILFGVLAFATRFPLALVLVSCALFLVFTRQKELIKDRNIWKASFWGLICLSPYLIYFIINKFAALQFYFGDQAVSVHQDIGWHVLTLLFNLPESAWMISFILGILSLYNLVLCFDLILKRKTNEFDSDLFVGLFLILHLVFYVIIFREGTDRWLLMLMPIVFVLSGKGIMWVHDLVKKYSESIAVLFVIVIVLFGGYQNLQHGHALTVDKKESYLEVKLAGQWLKENTPENAKIITASIVQNQYYSERQSYDYYYNNSQMPKDCIDKFGATSLNDSCQLASESLFEQKRQIINPDYFIISAFEPTFTPAWAYSYPQKNNLTAVQAYFDNQNRPLLIIYKY